MHRTQTPSTPCLSSMQRSEMPMLNWLPAFFLFSALLIPGAPELGVAVFALTGLFRLLRQPAHTASQWHRQDTSMAMAMSAVFVFKLTSMLWAAEPALAMRNALWHFHFLLWPLVYLGLQACNTSRSAMDKGNALGLIATTAWFVWTRIFGPFPSVQFEGGTTSHAMLGQLSLILGTWNFFAMTRAGLSKAHRQLHILAFVCTFTLLYASIRRIELMSFVLIVIAGSAYRFRLALQNRRTFWLGLTACALLLTLVLWLRKDRYLLALQEVIQYFSAQGNDAAVVQTSLGARLEMYRLAFLAIGDHFWFGMSAGIRPHLLQIYGAPDIGIFGHRHFHSEYIQTWAEGGLVWACLFSLAIGHAIRQLVLKPWQTHPEMALLACGILSTFALAGLFSAALVYGPPNAMLVVCSAWIWSQVRSMASDGQAV